MSDFYCQNEAGKYVLTPTARNRIKFAAKELRRLAGMGLVEIAERTGVSKSQWHNYENLDAPDLIPAQVYLPLELELGHAPVTRAFAAMNGLTVSAEANAEQRAEVAELMCLAVRENGEALATLIEAGVDGKISPNEARKIASDFGDLRRVAERVEGFVARIISGEA